MNVYAIQEFPSRLIKIGKSINPEHRLRELRVGNPHLLELIGYLKFDSDSQALDIENLLHGHFKTFKVRNEWFKIVNHTTDILQEMATVASCGKIVYHKRVFYTVPQELIWYIPKLKTLNQTPSNLRFYKKQMKTYRKLYDHVKQYGSNEDINYVRKFKPSIREEAPQEEKVHIKSNKPWKSLKERNPKRYAELFGSETEQPRKSSEELFAEFGRHGS